MLGSGIFINTVLLSINAGAASPLVYVAVGLLFFPLIHTVAHLLVMHKGGTFYHFGAVIHPLMGFISSWSYFSAKMASSVLSIHVFVTLMQQIFPALGLFSPLIYDAALVLLFVWLNSFNLQMGSAIQFYFMIFKMVPLLFAIISGIFLFKLSFFGAEAFHWAGVPLSFPLVIFAFCGFEASCSLSKNIENPEKNGPRALFLSYTIVLLLAVLYQTLFYGSLGTVLEKLTSFKEAFPALCNALSFSTETSNLVIYIMHIGIAVSALGASYGIMYSNAWNLHALASHNHIAYASRFTTLNTHSVPFLCIVAEGVLALFYLALTQGQQVPLQQISALGSTIAYSISVVSCIILLRKKNLRISPITLCALVSCSVFFGTLIYAYKQKGAYSLLLFSALFLFGISQYCYKNLEKKV